ncbi:MAG TPA: carboxypeptidase-like regulatory domain-containing protein, partial [Terriglobia bacterium]|nr:carboxypeptidase-like regulatory domain-containing protein [Terriglobia bacterium]
MPPKNGIWPRQPVWVFLALTLSVATAWPLPQTQDLKGTVVNSKGLPLAAAVCTLKGLGLPAEGVTMTTGERGEFVFPGLQPGQYDLACAAAGHLPATQNGIQMNPANPMLLQVVLPDVEKLRQSVEVHEEATPLATESANPSRHVNSQ